MGKYVHKTFITVHYYICILLLVIILRFTVSNVWIKLYHRFVCIIKRYNVCRVQNCLCNSKIVIHWVPFSVFPTHPPIITIYKADLIFLRLFFFGKPLVGIFLFSPLSPLGGLWGSGQTAKEKEIGITWGLSCGRSRLLAAEKSDMFSHMSTGLTYVHRSHSTGCH